MNSMLSLKVKRVLSHRGARANVSLNDDHSCTAVIEKIETRETTSSDFDGERVSWLQLEALYDRDPGIASQRWDEIIGAAKEELTNGLRAARVVEGARPKPFDRARFFALREQLTDEWNPRNGIEVTLIDTMAQAQTMQLLWMETLAIRATLDIEVGNERAADSGKWTAPRVGDYRGIDQAALLADRFSRVFARALRSLTDLRRHVSTNLPSRPDQITTGPTRENATGSGCVKSSVVGCLHMEKG